MLLILKLRLEHVLGKDRNRIGKDPAEKLVGEKPRDAVTQYLRREVFPVIRKAWNLFQVAILDHGPGVVLEISEPAPDFRHKEACAMVDLVFGAGVPGGSDEGAPSRCVGDEGGVEVVDGKQLLKGLLVMAPSEPAPVVEGDLPVTETIKSMKSSGSSR